MSASRLNIIFSGMIAGDPYQGGATWAILQYLLGFRRLGHHVTFIEPLAAAAVRPTEKELNESDNAIYFRQVMREFGLDDSSALLHAETRRTIGVDYDALVERARNADVIINVSGMLTDPLLLSRPSCRVYLDLDPAFIQLWSAVQGIDMRFAGHTHYVTVGQNLGHPDCPVPTCGLSWIPTAQPLVLQHWPAATNIAINALTTIGNWRGYGSIEHQGVLYGQKAHSWRPLFDLPLHTTEQFMPALSIHPGETKDVDALRQNRWQLLDPAKVAATPRDYQRFIAGSKAEIGIAKSGYVHSNCGWFSDRSVCYLASGRPVIAQDTGFGRWLPTGRGLFSFRTRDEAVAAIAEMNRDYPAHSAAARKLAESHFDSDLVLTRLLQAIGVCS